MSREPRIYFDSFAREDYAGTYSFTGFREVIVARSAEEVLPALERVEEAVSQGLHAVGCISYEAASALGQALPTGKPAHFPLVWFALYERRFATTPPDLAVPNASEYSTSDWTASVTEQEYEDAITSIREYIAAGDVYQVNFTLRHRFRFHGDAFSFYRDLCRAQRAPFCAFIDTGEFQILSVSPELFFDLHHGNLTARPMKGTAPRGKWHADDEEMREQLKKGRKERAENLMIVDLLRNDMSKVSVTGSVKVPSLFDVETLDTVHQMTSTITSRLKPGTGMVELFRSMFPCGSITGAPKRRSMEIIEETENSPRGLYTGCIGYISPKGDALFSVAIRTIVIDAAAGTGELGTGGGITWDSTAASEYEECLTKSRFAREVRPDFQLIETLLYQEDEGYFLLERHMARLYRSSNYFGFTLRLGAVLDILNVRARPLQGKHKVRLLLSRNGTFSVQTEQLPASAEEQMAIVTLAHDPIDSRNPFLYHKTTNRRIYERELERHPDSTDVIFHNERGEITEGARHNVVVNINGRMLTPPLAAGLLPGTFREELLASQIVREKPISVQDLRSAEDIFLINSVRKWRKVQLI